jgi:uncharacterized membrane protein
MFTVLLLVTLQTALPPEIQTVVTTIVTSIMYAIAAYSHKWQKEETFSPRKVLRTVIVGLLVGLAAVAYGLEVTPDSVVTIAQSFGLVAVADHLSKTIINQLRNYAEK